MKETEAELINQIRGQVRRIHEYDEKYGATPIGVAAALIKEKRRSLLAFPYDGSSEFIDGLNFALKALRVAP